MSATSETHEIDLLLGQLDAQRNHVLGILEGLDEDALRRPVLPSGWSCVGLLQHLALDDERFWFQAVVVGDQAVIDGVLNAPEDAWQVAADAPVEQVFALYREHSDRTNTIIRTTPLDAEPAWWPDFFGDFRMNSLREIVLHVLTETAAHAGHLDAARELIDGRTWLVL